MRNSPLLQVSLAVLLGLSAFPGIARAQHMDLELWRLGNPGSDDRADQRFETLMTDLGLATHPTPGAPPNSLGRAGTIFELNLRLPQIHPNASIDGTQCPPGNPDCYLWVTRGRAPERRRQQPPLDRLVIPSLQVRKGLPMSFELSGRTSYLVGSSALALGGGLRWSLNEGFDFLPDLSVGAQINRIVTSSDYGLTTGSVDVLFGKWFPLAGSAVVGPYFGWQRVWISAFSAVIDFNPSEEIASDPTRFQKIFEAVSPLDNGYDRVVAGLRIRSYVAHFLIEGSYQPEFLGLDPTVNLTFGAGLDF